MKDYTLGYEYIDEDYAILYLVNGETQIISVDTLHKYID